MVSIQLKMFISFGLCLTLAIAIIAYSSYNSSAAVVERNAIAFISDRIQGADSNLASMVEEADRISKVIVANREVIRSALENADSAPSYGWFKSMQSVEQFLSSMMAYKGYLQKITIVGSEDRIYQTGARHANENVVFHWIKNDSFLENRMYLIYQPESTGKIMLVRPILDSGQRIGLCIVEFNSTILDQVYGIESLSRTSITVMDGHKQLINHFNSNSSISGEETAEIELLNEHIEPDVFHHRLIEINGDMHLVVQTLSSYTQWRTIATIPMRDLLEEVSDMRYRIISIAALTLIIVLLISTLLSNHITKNIRRLRNAMKLVREGHIGARPAIRSEDEIGQLSLMFSSMMDRVQGLLQEVKERERQRREAEYRELQAQINPHFLYNTLNTIKFLANIQSAKNIEEISGTLIELMRYAIDPNREMITIREELDQIRRYVTIQNYRYLDRVQLSISAEDAALEARIPKLILQPLVENAYLHGFGSTIDRGTIHIRIYLAGRRQIKMTVTDDGAGINRERMAYLTKDLQKDASSSSLGLRNVRSRIRHTYGEPYGLQLYSEPGRFTAVELYIPFIDEDEHA